jgi:lipopolysaccharide assembly outer membrane protein LptD (OstA)
MLSRIRPATSDNSAQIIKEADKTAVVTGKNVILQDQNMTLLSTELQYNIKNQVGFYTKGADILSDQNTLKSRKGYYNRRSNTFNFKDNVQLKSPDYTMYSDTLDYFASTRTAYFYGPTRIISKENKSFIFYGISLAVQLTIKGSKFLTHTLE